LQCQVFNLKKTIMGKEIIRILNLLFINLFLLSCSSKEDSLTKGNLKGEVKSVRESFYYNPTERFGEVEKGPLSSVKIYNYEKNGNMKERIKYDKDGYMTSKIIYHYDSNGNMKEEISYNRDRSLRSKKVYKYNEKGEMIEEIHSDEESVYVKFFLKYDDSGNLIELTAYSIDEPFGDLPNIREMSKYDRDGNRIELKAYNREEVSFRNTYNYDYKGNMIEFTQYEDDGYVNVKKKYNYDHNGNMIEENSYVGDNLSHMIKYNYEYDKEGNWTSKSKSVNEGAPSQLIEREIEYY